MQRLYDKVEAFVSRLSMRDNFWNSICSLIWMPLAFFSGIRMKELDGSSFAARAVLPFRRFNRKLGIAPWPAGRRWPTPNLPAGRMFLALRRGLHGGLQATQLHVSPSLFLGPAVYRMTPRENITTLLATHREFNITIDMESSTRTPR